MNVRLRLVSRLRATDLFEGDIKLFHRFLQLAERLSSVLFYQIHPVRFVGEQVDSRVVNHAFVSEMRQTFLHL
jgi:hypothetical protein